MKRESLIRLSKSSIGADEKRAVMGVLDREYLGMGVEVQNFEKALTEFFGRPALCVVNGTAALHLALQACGIGRGDEVLVQSLTYVASFQAISATGAVPIPCDIDPLSLTLYLQDAEKRLTPRTKAIMPVHYSGGVGELDQIYSFARTHGLRVIEDAAHAFGTTYKGKRVGGFGDIACFSFDGIKNITSGEGGCVVTSDPDVIRAIQDARLLGVENDTVMRYSDQRSWTFDVSRQGWRYHMSNIMAAIGIEQLKRISEFALKRKLLAQAYDKHLRENPNIKLLNHDYSSVVPHIFVVEILNGLDRDLIRQALADKLIQTGIHYPPNHMLSLYSEPVLHPLLFTDSLYPRLLSLPLHVDMDLSDVSYICSELIDALSR